MRMQFWHKNGHECVSFPSEWMMTSLLEPDTADFQHLEEGLSFPSSVIICGSIQRFSIQCQQYGHLVLRVDVYMSLTFMHAGSHTSQKYEHPTCVR